MRTDEHITAAARLMTDFAARTGLSTSARPPRRYLWTDAFALCNFLSLFTATGDGRYRALALQLIDQVHHVLARHRPQSARQGWISGLSEEEGRRHPLAGGLRIGKKLDERGPEDPFDPEAEWDRDGQYFHYLTKWIHALTRAGAVLGEPLLLKHAAELAVVAVKAFTYSPPGRQEKRMYWKMSIDLSRPQVTSMGQHDPLDGYVTLLALIRAMSGLGLSPTADLCQSADILSSMCRGRDWFSTDPLGIGGLLFDACRMTQLLIRNGDMDTDTDAGPNAHADTDMALLADMLNAAENGLAHWLRLNQLNAPPAHRLAFRELGLAIGLKAAPLMNRLMRHRDTALPEAVIASWSLLSANIAIAEHLESFWMKAANRSGAHWRDHEDINSVMLATSLLPDQFLSLRSGAPAVNIP